MYSLCMCVHTFAWVGACVHMCACTCGGQRLAVSIFLHVSTLFTTPGSLTEPRTVHSSSAQSSSTACPRISGLPGISDLPTITLKFHRKASHRLSIGLFGSWGYKLWSSHLCGKQALYSQSRLLSSAIAFYKSVKDWKRKSAYISSSNSLGS